MRGLLILYFFPLPFQGIFRFQEGVRCEVLRVIRPDRIHLSLGGVCEYAVEYVAACDLPVLGGIQGFSVGLIGRQQDLDIDAFFVESAQPRGLGGGDWSLDASPRDDGVELGEVLIC